MKAVLLHKFGGPEELYIGQAPDPQPTGREVLVKVHAAALNRADLLQRQGKYPPPEGASDILGLEMAGEVVQAPAGSRWQPGDRVMGLLAGGGQAELVAVHEDLLMPIPDNLSYIEAAAIPEVFLTAYQTLFTEGKGQQGETVLIHAGGSGVGTAAIQLAVQAGMQVVVTCSSGKHAVCLQLGAAKAIDYRTEKFDEAALAFTGNKGVNLILDFIGAPNFAANIRALAQTGRLILIALMGGFKAQEISLLPILRKHITIIGTTLRSRPLSYKVALVQAFVEQMLPLFASGELKPVIDSVYQFTDVALAHEHMAANRNIGKIILQIS